MQSELHFIELFGHILCWNEYISFVYITGTCMKLIKVLEYKCNRCDDPSKPSTESTADPSTQRKRTGTIGRNCDGRMVLKIYELYENVDDDKYAECVGIISDSLPHVHSRKHDISWKYV